MVKAYELPSKEKVRMIEKKLEKCRNQENNPDSQMWVQVVAIIMWFNVNNIFSKILSLNSCFTFQHYSYKERMRKMLCDDDLDLPLDSSYHVADSSAEMSKLSVSQESVWVTEILFLVSCGIPLLLMQK